ncbi:uncharacterized protein LOC118079436 [Zootoca vivipara]|uniref:uncharacterized protein LOC118079436 n=1 Tax=Zootoca vivipara TaxID=8524 RepID=UPI00293BEA00|nr:uncharacterized protein LOC118079436 [Zootoca vivipara]
MAGQLGQAGRTSLLPPRSSRLPPGLSGLGALGSRVTSVRRWRSSSRSREVDRSEAQGSTLRGTPLPPQVKRGGDGDSGGRGSKKVGAITPNNHLSLPLPSRPRRAVRREILGKRGGDGDSGGRGSKKVGAITPNDHLSLPLPSRPRRAVRREILGLGASLNQRPMGGRVSWIPTRRARRGGGAPGWSTGHPRHPRNCSGGHSGSGAAQAARTHRPPSRAPWCRGARHDASPRTMSIDFLSISLEKRGSCQIQWYLGLQMPQVTNSAHLEELPRVEKFAPG